MTSASQATSTWQRTMSLAAHPASATDTPPSAPRPLAILRVGGAVWNATQRSRIRVVEMSYRRGACGVSGWDGESNESMYYWFNVGGVCSG